MSLTTARSTAFALGVWILIFGTGAAADALDDQLSILQKSMATYKPGDTARAAADMGEASRIGHEAYRAKRWELAHRGFAHQARIAEIFRAKMPDGDRFYLGMAMDWKTLSSQAEMAALSQKLRSEDALDDAKSIIGRVGIDVEELDTIHVATLIFFAKSAYTLFENKSRLNKQGQEDLAAMCNDALDKVLKLPRKGAWRTAGREDFDRLRGFCAP